MKLACPHNVWMPWPMPRRAVAIPWPWLRRAYWPCLGRGLAMSLQINCNAIAMVVSCIFSAYATEYVIRVMSGHVDDDGGRVLAMVMAVLFGMMMTVDAA